MSNDPTQRELWQKISQNTSLNRTIKLESIPEYLSENQNTGFLMESSFAEYLTSEVE